MSITRLRSCVAIWLLSACAQDDPAPIFLKIDYQVRCLECEPRTVDDPAHTLRAVHGAQGFEVACTGDRIDGRPSYSVSVRSDERQVNGADGFALELRHIQLGDEPTNNCTVIAREGPNSYEGRCSPAAPSDAIPCQVVLRAEASGLHGTLLCESIPNRATRALRRSVVKSGTREPAEFEAHGCPGL